MTALFAISAHTFATPATDSSVNKLFQTVDIISVLDQYLKSNIDDIDKQAIAIVRSHSGHAEMNTDEHLLSIKISSILQEMSNSLIHNPDTLNAFKQVYKNNFTEEELNSYIQFLATPEGQSIFKKSILISNEFSNLGKKMMENQINSPEFQQKYGKQIHDILQQLKSLNMNK